MILSTVDWLKHWCQHYKIEVLSAYPGEELNGQNPFTECAMQEIKFFGKS